MGFKLKRIRAFLVKWNEFVTIPIGLLLWRYMPALMRWSGFDSTAGEYDGVVFMKIIYSIMALSILSGIAWLFIKITFPNVYNFLDNTLGQSMNQSYTNQQGSLSKWHKSKIALVLLLAYLFFLVFLVSVI